MTNFKISAVAPTVYQSRSLSAFGMGSNKSGNGSFWAEKEFDTEKEAKAFLVTRAERYFDGNSDNDEANLQDALESIEKYGMLRLDAVTASIEEVEVEESEKEDEF
jgi:hypothetical protein